MHTHTLTLSYTSTHSHTFTWLHTSTMTRTSRLIQAKNYALISYSHSPSITLRLRSFILVPYLLSPFWYIFLVTGVTVMLEGVTIQGDMIDKFPCVCFEHYFFNFRVLDSFIGDSLSVLCHFGEKVGKRRKLCNFTTHQLPGRTERVRERDGERERVWVCMWEILLLYERNRWEDWTKMEENLIAFLNSFFYNFNSLLSGRGSMERRRREVLG